MNKQIMAVVLLFLISVGGWNIINAQVQKEHEISAGRHVKGNLLVSGEYPEITIEVSDEFAFIGTFDFEIIANSDEYPQEMQGKAVASGERFVFASADEDKNVSKLFIVQFEGFLNDNDFTYNYNFDQAEFIGENKYRHNTWFYDSKQLAEDNPQNEGAKTRAFLQDEGYTLDDHFMMSRFVGLASKDRKKEIIIYYIEMLKQTTGYSLQEYEDSVGDEEAATIRRDFVERSRNSFKIIKG